MVEASMDSTVFAKEGGGRGVRRDITATLCRCEYNRTLCTMQRYQM